MGYGYDAASRRSSMTVPGQPAASYSYDTANRLSGISRGSDTVGFSYDAAGRPAALTLPNGIVATYSFDAANQLSGCRSAAAWRGCACLRQWPAAATTPTS